MFTKVIVSSLLLAAAGLRDVAGAPVRRDLAELERKDLGTTIENVLQEVDGFGGQIATFASSVIQELPGNIATPAASVLSEIEQDVGGVFGFATSIAGAFLPAPTPGTTPPAAPTSAGPAPIVAVGGASTVNIAQTPQGTTFVRPVDPAAAVGGAISNPQFTMITLAPTTTTAAPSSSGSSSSTTTTSSSAAASTYPAAPQRRDIGSDLQNLLGGLTGAEPQIASVANAFINILPSSLAAPASSLLNVATSDVGLLLGSPTPTSSGTSATTSATGSSSATTTTSASGSSATSSSSSTSTASSTSAAPSASSSSGALKTTVAGSALAVSFFLAAFIAI